jgi:formylglycine-generating enzyme required for sulfatase activity
MKRTALFFLMMTLSIGSASAQRIPVKHVAVVETDIRPSVANEITRDEAMEITNVIRREAVRALPKERYNIMTAETVLAMGEAVLAECAEENCIITLGSKIGADYIVRGTINKFRTMFSLTVELYETEWGNLISVADAVRSANLEDLLEKSQRASADMYKRFLEIGPRASPQATPAPVPATRPEYASAPKSKPQSAPEPPPANFADDKTGIEMVFVKGGMFLMGCTNERDGCDGNEKPARPVTLSDFYIGKYEVTQKQWRMIMGKNKSRFQGDDLPVTNVSWDDIQKFIVSLNRTTGKNYRLPTEAEWEYAARGGSNDKNFKYAGSNNIGDVAWYDANARGYAYGTHRVGTKAPNELGIYDMSGNVWEWVKDFYDKYTTIQLSNPSGPSFGTYHVIRGGSWSDNAGNNRVSRRTSNYGSYRTGNLGFRLAMSSSAAPQSFVSGRSENAMQVIESVSQPQAQTVPAYTEPENKTLKFSLAAKYMIPAPKMIPKYGAYMLELAWIRKNGFYQGFDLGFGHYYSAEKDEGHLAILHEVVGATLNNGWTYEIGNMRLEYGVSVGLWMMNLEYDGYSGEESIEEMPNLGFGGPFIRLYWRHLEISYRAMIGTRVTDWEWNIEGLSYNTQLTVGVRFAFPK